MCIRFTCTVIHHDVNMMARKQKHAQLDMHFPSLQRHDYIGFPRYTHKLHVKSVKLQGFRGVYIYIYLSICVCNYFACYDSMLMYNVSSLVLNVFCVRVSLVRF